MKRKGYSLEHAVDLILQHWLRKNDAVEEKLYRQMLEKTGVTDGKEELEETVRLLQHRDIQAERRQERAYEAFSEAIRRQKFRMLGWWCGAAVIILLVGVGGSFSLLRDKRAVVLQNEMIVAQSSKVYLTMSDGSRIGLDTDKEILVVDEERLKVVADSNGGLRYVNKQKSVSEAEIRYNTLTIPRGCEYFILLGDGTKVWLEADSYLEYPETFGEDKREVRLKGEAYFEVAKDSLRPFIVRSGAYRMQVYGTEFNLNTSDETRVQLVLVKGSVGFQANESAEEMRLMPGQLGESNVLTGECQIENVDINRYISWKDGYIIFENECLESIMEKISRWYDVDVFFENEDLKSISFYGNLERYKDVNEFLKCLGKASDVCFKVKNKTIVVGKQ